LFAIQLAVDSDELDWTDPVTIRDELDSFPGGTTQDVEPGTTLTVRELAELMISISDNTATDHLIDLVGRDAVEAAVVAGGHANPGLLTPFLNTRELFVLKTVFTQAEREAYIAADSDARRVILDETVAETPLGLLADIVWPVPIDIDTLEWFGSPADVCRVISALASTSETREILAINPGVDAGGRWGYLAFKGGSEPGVLAASWYVESPLGAPTSSPARCSTATQCWTKPRPSTCSQPSATSPAPAERLGNTFSTDPGAAVDRHRRTDLTMTATQVSELGLRGAKLSESVEQWDDD